MLAQRGAAGAVAPAARCRTYSKAETRTITSSRGNGTLNPGRHVNLGDKEGTTESYFALSAIIAAGR